MVSTLFIEFCFCWVCLGEIGMEKKKKSSKENNFGIGNYGSKPVLTKIQGF
jgi:hypothetical protein